LEQGNGKIISLIYKRNIGAVRNMVNQFSNIILEADDVIQEGLTRAIMNIRDKKYKGASSIHTYLYGICKNICLKECQKSKIFSSTNATTDLIDEPQEDNYDLLQLVIKIKEEMEQKCIEIIDLRFSLQSALTPQFDLLQQEAPAMMPFEEIAHKLGIQPDNARQRFKRCLEKLIEAINADKQTKEFF
jgi:RNA polymerase sigma factor (sigma-70 family)